MPKKIFALIIFSWLCFNYIPASYAIDETLPDTATLSANRMRFDSETGDFLADGDVTITAGELQVDAPIGTGNIDTKIIDFDRGIKASGKWQGDKVDIKAGRLLLSFSDIPTCRFQNGVKGGIGALYLDADRLTLTGMGGLGDPTPKDMQTKFSLAKVRSMEDRSRGMTFGADSVEGVLRAGELYDLTAKRGVWLKGRPKANEAPVSLRGDNALYSLERGSVVVSGHVTAIQGGRTLKSDSVVYFPDLNRVEALGGLTRTSDGTMNQDRAEITIDLSRERNAKPAQTPTRQEARKKAETTAKKAATSKRKVKK